MIGVKSCRVSLVTQGIRRNHADESLQALGKMDLEERSLVIRNFRLGVRNPGIA